MAFIGELSPQLEDYIEVIYQLIAEKKEARVKDVAEKKSIRMASVNNALKRLSAEGYINHKTYGSIKLTEKGKKLGKTLVKRHLVLKNFFEDIININPDIADKDACAIEHHIHKETVDGILKYVAGKGRITTLKEIQPGSSCRIRKIKLTGEIKHKLLEMGLIVGEKVFVERIAPLGDPIGIKVKKYRLSIRKAEASKIEVQEIN